MAFNNIIQEKKAKTIAGSIVELAKTEGVEGFDALEKFSKDGKQPDNIYPCLHEIDSVQGKRKGKFHIAYEDTNKLRDFFLDIIPTELQVEVWAKYNNVNIPAGVKYFAKGGKMADSFNEKIRQAGKKKPVKVDTKENVEKLAKEFSKILNEWLSKDEITEINKRNATEEYKGNCATHDFCDPNQAMLDAFENVMGRELVFFNGDVPESEKQNEYDMALWSKAWTLAHNNKFSTTAKYDAGGLLNKNIEFKDFGKVVRENESDVIARDMSGNNNTVPKSRIISSYAKGGVVPKGFTRISGSPEGKGIPEDAKEVNPTPNVTQFKVGNKVVAYYYHTEDYSLVRDEFLTESDEEENSEAQDMADRMNIPVEVIEEWVSDTGADVDSAEDAYQGAYKDEEDYAYSLVDDGVITDLTNYLDMTDTDRRIVAGEESDREVEDLDEDELIEKANMESELKELEDKRDSKDELETEVANKQDEVDDLEGEDEPDEEKVNAAKANLADAEAAFAELDGFDFDDAKTELSDKAKEQIRSERYDEIYDELKDPVQYFVNDQGTYSAEDLAKANFIRVDYAYLAKELKHDHTFIDGPDGMTYVFSDNYAKGGKIKETKQDDVIRVGDNVSINQEKFADRKANYDKRDSNIKKQMKLYESVINDIGEVYDKGHSVVGVKFGNKKISLPVSWLIKLPKMEFGGQPISSGDVTQPVYEHGGKTSSPLEMSKADAEAYIKKASREDLISILKSNDPNGIYTDAESKREFGKPASKKDLTESFWRSWDGK